MALIINAPEVGNSPAGPRGELVAVLLGGRGRNENL
ncbi:MAG: hypothetical protein ACI9W2_004538 [Gammaproteobacteria bacterium]|jgi:hypothetical protein